MAYFGKEFTFDREENMEEFINAIGATEGSALDFLRYTPSQVIEKDGDSYKLMLKGVNHEVVFKAGVPFTEVIRGTLESKTTITVEGDTFTEVQDFGSHGILTSKREYSADGLKVTYTCSKWCGVAYRYFKA
ncbi:hypothetical protein ABMA28_008843 [Loxostege sticticalis]|uniref:Uncharacterized protein n=1 Tax=Loxostege sticticalis TaxID=481309 RepID=A0ABD0SEW2_LOXSC